MRPLAILPNGSPDNELDSLLSSQLLSYFFVLFASLAKPPLFEQPPPELTVCPHTFLRIQSAVCLGGVMTSKCVFKRQIPFFFFFPIAPLGITETSINQPPDTNANALRFMYIKGFVWLTCVRRWWPPTHYAQTRRQV